MVLEDVCNVAKHVPRLLGGELWGGRTAQAGRRAGACLRWGGRTSQAGWRAGACLRRSVRTCVGCVSLGSHLRSRLCWVGPHFPRAGFRQLERRAGFLLLLLLLGPCRWSSAGGAGCCSSALRLWLLLRRRGGGGGGGRGPCPWGLLPLLFMAFLGPRSGTKVDQVPKAISFLSLLLATRP